MKLDTAASILKENGYAIVKAVMLIYYGIESNKHRPVVLEKMNTSKIYQRHRAHGLVILSANRSAESEETNITNTKELLQNIKREGYRYLPVYGGYRGTDGVEDDYEPSFIVFPYDIRKNSFVEFDDLYDFALEMRSKYNQDSVFIMKPGEAPNHVDRHGKIVNTGSSKELYVNDLSKQFFTSFKDKDAVDSEINSKLMKSYKQFAKTQPNVSFADYKQMHLDDIKTIVRRFTSDIRYEWFVNPAPCTLNERRRRTGSGEILLDEH